MKKETQPKDETVAGIYEKLKGQASKSKKDALTFDELKPIVEAMIKGQSMYELHKQLGDGVKYSTIIQRRKVALEFLNPNNKKRQLSAADEAWLKEAYKLHSAG